MHEVPVLFTFVIFALTTLFIMWRPFGINEAIPAMIGALILIVTNIVSYQDIFDIFRIVSGPSITIVSTIMMCIILENIGVFSWAAINIVKKAKGSGVRLFFYTLFLCFLMTVFFNNDGSILITTPIIIHMISILDLKPKQKLPYLFGGVFIATVSSLPMGVSNIANLIGLKVVGLNLISYTNMVFVPSMIGICSLACLLYLFYRKDIPKKIPAFHRMHINKWTFTQEKKLKHPPLPPMHVVHIAENNIDWSLFRICIAIVIIVRGSYFLLSPLGVHIEWIAIIGAAILYLIRWIKTRKGIFDVLKKTPWHIVLFAFGMYVTVYALNNSGITTVLIQLLQETVSVNQLTTIFHFGLLTTLLSNVMNNLPAVMLGTLILTDLGLEPFTLQISYLAIIIGSDIGALLTPLGTLATLLWMFVLRREGIPVTWGHYFKVAIMVIPITLIVTLMIFYLWVMFILP